MMSRKKLQNKNVNIWKIIAISAIVMFLVIILFGALKMQHFKKKYQILTDKERENVLQLVEKTMLERGEEIGEYSILSRYKKREIRIENKVKNIMSIILSGENKSYSFVIDLDEMNIARQTESTYIGWMRDANRRFSHNNNKKSKRHWGK
jgi:hypothetical protein